MVVGEERIRARRVIIAVPPPLVRRIRFTPELPAEHRHAREHQSFGLVIKVQAEYADAVLARAGAQRHRLRSLRARARGLRQHPRRLDRPATWSASSPTRQADRVGRLGDDERRDAVLASLAAYFGDAARSPVTYVESDWQHQELTGGAYGTSFDDRRPHEIRPGAPQPLGPIEFGTQRRLGPRLPARRRRGPRRHRDRRPHPHLRRRSMIKNVIDGALCAALDGRVSDVVDPSTGKSYDVAALSGAADVDAAYAAATRAFRTWRRTTPAERQRALMALADALEARTDDLVAAEVENTGKPVELTRSEEIAAGIDHLRFFAGAARSLEGASAGEYLAGHTSYVRREPVGVVGQVAPWNYPFMMAIWKIAPALAAGNTVVLKPSDTTPVTASLLGEIAAGVLPPGVLNVVCGDRDTGRLVVSHADRGDGLDHRVDRCRQAGRGRGGRARHAGPPRARRQGAGDRVRRRGSPGGGGGDRHGRLLQRGAGLHRRHPGAGAGGGRGTVPGAPGRGRLPAADRAAVRRGSLLRAAEQRQSARAGVGRRGVAPGAREGADRWAPGGLRGLLLRADRGGRSAPGRPDRAAGDVRPRADAPDLRLGEPRRSSWPTTSTSAWPRASGPPTTAPPTAARSTSTSAACG